MTGAEVHVSFDELIAPLSRAAGLIGDPEEADVDINKIFGRARGAFHGKPPYAGADFRWKMARGIEYLGDYLAKRPEVSDPVVLSELLLATQELADAIRRLIAPDEMYLIFLRERSDPRE